VKEESGLKLLKNRGEKRGDVLSALRQKKALRRKGGRHMARDDRGEKKTRFSIRKAGKKERREP